MSDNTYSYPLEGYWSTREMLAVVDFYNQVEASYETGTSSVALLMAYRSFKQVIPSKGEEKRLGQLFYQVSGYSSYMAITAAKANPEGRVCLARKV